MNLSTPELERNQAPSDLSGTGPDRLENAAGDFPSGRRSNLFLMAGLLVAVAIALGFGFWYLSRQLAPQLISSTAPAETNRTTPLPDKSIAVLPFENLSEGEENAFLADGVQGGILSALSKVADLKVISRTSVNGYAAGSTRNLRE